VTSTPRSTDKHAPLNAQLTKAPPIVPVSLPQALGPSAGESPRSTDKNAPSSTDKIAPRCDRFGQETYGESPLLTGRLGAAYVRGMQTPGGSGTPLHVRSVAKHFAVYRLRDISTVPRPESRFD
jgi:hypothetical protein